MNEGERGKGVNEQQYLEQFSGESFEDLLDDIPDERLEALDEILGRWFTEHPEQSNVFSHFGGTRIQMQRSAGNVIDEMIELENETARQFWVNPKPVDL